MVTDRQMELHRMRKERHDALDRRRAAYAPRPPPPRLPRAHRDRRRGEISPRQAALNEAIEKRRTINAHPDQHRHVHYFGENSKRNCEVCGRRMKNEIFHYYGAGPSHPGLRQFCRACFLRRTHVTVGPRTARGPGEHVQWYVRARHIDKRPKAMQRLLPFRCRKGDWTIIQPDQVYDVDEFQSPRDINHVRDKFLRDHPLCDD